MFYSLKTVTINAHNLSFYCTREMNIFLYWKQIHSRMCWAMSLHMEVCWQPNISPRSPTLINYWSKFASNGWSASLRRYKKKTLGWMWERKSKPRMWLMWEGEREHTRTLRPSEKRVRRRRRRGESVQFWPVCLQAGGWGLKSVWIGFKLGELIPYFEYFDMVT
jgi:hypothetical protein